MSLQFFCIALWSYRFTLILAAFMCCRNVAVIPPLYMEHCSGLRPGMPSTPGHAYPFWDGRSADERSRVHHQWHVGQRLWQKGIWHSRCPLHLQQQVYVSLMWWCDGAGCENSHSAHRLRRGFSDASTRLSGRAALFGARGSLVSQLLQVPYRF